MVAALEHVEEDSPADLLGPSPANSDPLASIKKALLEGFCGPPSADQAQSPTKEQESTPTNTTSASSRSISSNPAADVTDAKPKSQVIVNDDLKKTLELVHDEAAPPDTTGSSSSGGCDHSLAITRSYDSEEKSHSESAEATATEKQAPVSEEKRAEEEDEGLVVVLTRSGTNRIVRVARGLETFFYVLVLVSLTLSLLRLLDGNSLGLEIRNETAEEDSSFFSMSKVEEDLPRDAVVVPGGDHVEERAGSQLQERITSITTAAEVPAPVCPSLSLFPQQDESNCGPRDSVEAPFV